MIITVAKKTDGSAEGVICPDTTETTWVRIAERETEFDIEIPDAPKVKRTRKTVT